VIKVKALSKRAGLIILLRWFTSLLASWISSYPREVAKRQNLSQFIYTKWVFMSHTLNYEKMDCLGVILLAWSEQSSISGSGRWKMARHCTCANLLRSVWYRRFFYTAEVSR